MVAMLLFSAMLHVATVALLAATVMPMIFEKNGTELDTQEFAKVAALFGVAVGVVAALLLMFFHPLGRSLLGGLVVGVIAAVLVSLFTAVRPLAPSLSGGPWHSRPHALVFYGTFAVLQVTAFCFLIAILAGLPH